MPRSDATTNEPQDVDGVTQLVQREKEWKLIHEQIRLRQSGPVLSRSVIVLYGTAGIGKTTLLLRTLRPRITKHYPLIPHALIDFDTDAVGPRYEDGIGSRGRLVVDIADQLQKATGQVSKDLLAAMRKWEKVAKTLQHPPDDEPAALLSAEAELVEAFQHYVISCTRDRERRPVLIMLDTVEDISRDLLLWIQEELQDPTTATGYVLWIMASRIRVDCEPYYLRERYLWHPMQPFDADQVAEQVGAQYQFLAPNLYKLSFGLPAATKVLTKSVQELDEEFEEEEHRRLEAEDLERASVFDRLIASLNDLLQYRRYLGQKDDDIREALRVMSPLRLFNPGIVAELLPKLLPEYFERSASGAGALTVIQRMVQTNLVSWDRAKRGYAMEPPLRRIVALVLQHTNPPRFEQVHEIALIGYRRWANMPMQEKRKDYILETLYHQAWLLRLQGEEKPGRILKKELGKFIERFYLQDGPDLTALDEIHQQLQTDQEINDLLAFSDFQLLLEVVTSPKNVASDTEEETPKRVEQAS